MANAYTYVWEFEVPAEHVAEFERQYGPAGAWAQLFRRAPGFVETLLLRDNQLPGRYLTVDRWQSEEACRAFRSDFAVEYAQLDEACAALTVGERSLGGFSECGTG